MGDYETRAQAVWASLRGSGNRVCAEDWAELLVSIGVDHDTAIDLFAGLGSGTAADFLRFFPPYPILLDACYQEMELLAAKRLAAARRAAAKKLSDAHTAACVLKAKKLSIIPEADEQLMKSVLQERAARAVLAPVVLTARPGTAPCTAAHELAGSLPDEAAWRAFGQRLSEAWHAKEGTVLDELAANLKSPAEDVKVRRLAAAALSLKDTAPGEFGDLACLEVLALHLYTLASQDVDAVMGFADAPAYDPSNTAAWDAYRSRNAVIFRTVNWSLRTAPEREESWKTVRQWVKFIVLLMALASSRDPQTPRLARGLAGLPAKVVQDHQAMQEGQSVYWPAPSSCAVDPAVSEAYINGAAANATKASGADSGALLFLIEGTACGVPLQGISKYPAETEVLLPPLAHLTVSRVEEQDSHVAVHLQWADALATTDLQDLCKAARAEARQDSARLEGLSGETVEAVHMARLQVASQCAVLHEDARTDVQKTRADTERLERLRREQLREVDAAEARLADLHRMVADQQQRVDSLRARVSDVDTQIEAVALHHEAAKELQTFAGQEEEAANDRARDIEDEAAIERERSEGGLEKAEAEVRLMKGRAGKAKLEYRDACDAEEQRAREHDRAEALAEDAERALERIDEGSQGTQPDRMQLIEQEIRVCEQRDALRRHEEEHRNATRLLQEQRVIRPPAELSSRN